MNTTALIAEDEPLLARALERQLAEVWPELSVVARAQDGLSAVSEALNLHPQVMFLDIQMPGATGLEAAAEIADEWPLERPLPLMVFVTAYDQYALAAFERAAVDYVLKPTTAQRLQQTVARLKQRLQERQLTPERGASAALVQSVQGLHSTPCTPSEAASGASTQSSAASTGAAANEPIHSIRASYGPQGQHVRLIPLADVVCFEAADKYVNVITESHESLVRLSLRDLSARAQGVAFTQIHRSVLVNSARMREATRDEAGHYWLTVQGLKRPLKVSRAFSHLFRPM